MSDTQTTSPHIKQLDPKLLFDKDDIEELTESHIENQFIERKAKKEPRDIAQLVSGFANVNKGTGGLIALGIADDGTITGLNQHGGVQYINKLLTFRDSVSQARTEHKQMLCKNKDDKDDLILLIYVHYSENRVIELSNGKAYKRVGDKTIELRHMERAQLEHDKGQTDYELEMLSTYDEQQIDKDVFDEFMKKVREITGSSYDDPIPILKSKNLVREDRDKKVRWTVPGYLMFAINPKQDIAGAFIRFTRYEGREIKTGPDSNLVKDLTFEGPLAVQVRKCKEFVKTQIKEFTRLGPKGEFITEDEYPEFAWLEGIVNACVHRSYLQKNNRILISLFDDRIEIISPGPFPGMVTAANLEHYPRNPRLMGAATILGFTRELTEGTRRMRDEMKKSGLPPPSFRETETSVIVTLYNDIDGRDQKHKEKHKAQTAANIFPLTIAKSEDELASSSEIEGLNFKDIKRALVNALNQNGYKVNRTETAAVDLKDKILLPSIDDRHLGLYKGFRFRILHLQGDYFLVIDYHVEVLNKRKLDDLLNTEGNIPLEVLRNVHFKVDDEWKVGKITSISGNESRVQVRDEQQTFDFMINNSDLLPRLPFRYLNLLIKKQYPNVNLDQIVKEKSLLTMKNAARTRLERSKDLAKKLESRVFPLTVGDFTIYINPNPRELSKPYFDLHTELKEPNVSFDAGNRSPIILDGLTKSGAYEKPGQDINVVMLCTHDQKDSMKKLFEAIVKGSFKYQGSEKTFAVRLNPVGPFTTEKCEDYLQEIETIIPQLKRDARNIFLVYTPETYATDDANSPYFVIKKSLLENGFPSQMVDTPTLSNPVMKDLNLCLDLFAKVGFSPWVLEEGLPEADIFLGLSYSSTSSEKGIQRLMGYVNVFDTYGRWCFYKANTETFAYEDRVRHFSRIVNDSLKEFSKRKTLRHVHIHYTQKFSAADKMVLYDAIKKIIPQAVVYYVWINTTHPVRMFDLSVSGDGSLPRGNYVVTDEKVFYISTTGQNQLKQKAMGTPKLLEINVFTSPEKIDIEHDLLARHMLALTKLNWASSKSFCHEPITTKFAGDISYLVNMFMKNGQPFKLHESLSNTPWFL